MTVNLTTAQERFIQDQIRLGKYASAEELVAEGLQWIQAEDFIGKNLETLRQQLDSGLAALDRGESRPAAEVFSRLEKKLTGHS